MNRCELCDYTTTEKNRIKKTTFSDGHIEHLCRDCRESIRDALKNENDSFQEGTIGDFWATSEAYYEQLTKEDLENGRRPLNEAGRKLWPVEAYAVSIEKRLQGALGSPSTEGVGVGSQETQIAASDAPRGLSVDSAEDPREWDEIWEEESVKDQV